MHRFSEKEARQLLQRLERHWRPQYGTEELRHELRRSLRTIKHALARDSADARLVIHTWHRLLRHEARQHELDAANRALIRVLKSLGIAVLGVLPLGFITLPAVFGLAHHFGIELVPAGEEPGNDAPQAEA